MPNCPKCGARNPAENSVCRSCGALLEGDVPVGPPADGAAAEVPTAGGPALESGPEAAGLPWRRALLFGGVAAVVLGVLWYLQMVYWPTVPPFMAFVTGWLIGEAIRMGSGSKRGRPLQWLAVGLTAVTSAIVLFAYLGAQDPAGFPQALVAWISADWIAPAMLIFGLGYAYLTAGMRPRPRPQPQTPADEGAAAAPEAGGAATRAGEGETAPAADAAAEGAPPAEGAAAKPGLTCVRCQAHIAPGEALLVPGGFRRGTLAVCPTCVGELEAKFKAETEGIRLGQAVLFGVGAALLIGAGWYLGDRYSNASPMLNVLGLVAGWVIPEAVRWGAGKKRGRTLQWISLGLTVATILGAQLALALGDPNGFAAGLAVRMSSPLTVVIYLLGAFQAYTGPAARKLVGVKDQVREAGDGENPQP